MFRRDNATRKGLHMLVEHGHAEFMIISFQTTLTLMDIKRTPFTPLSWPMYPSHDEPT